MLSASKYGLFKGLVTASHLLKEHSYSLLLPMFAMLPTASAEDETTCLGKGCNVKEDQTESNVIGMVSLIALMGCFCLIDADVRAKQRKAAAMRASTEEARRASESNHHTQVQSRM